MTYVLAVVIVGLLFAVGAVASGHGEPMSPAWPDQPDAPARD